MDRMLGNQFYLARKFSQAIPYLERVHKKYPKDVQTAEKLILCCVFTSQLERATSFFLNLLKHSALDAGGKESVQNHAKEKELFADWTMNLPGLLSAKERIFALGMIATFFDINLASCYFRKARELDPKDVQVHQILENLKSNKRSCLY